MPKKQKFIVDATERWLYEVEADDILDAIRLVEEETYKYRSDMRGFDIKSIERIGEENDD